MSINAEEVISEINQLRTNPKGYGYKIVKYSEYFDDKSGKILRVPGATVGIKTTEGKEGYSEAADFLKYEAQTVCAFEPSEGLNAIAQDFLDKIIKMDPSRVSEINMDDIIARHGEFTGNFSRAIEFGSNTSEQVVINLVVCDGDKTRGQRDSLLNGNLKRVGVATGKHDTYRTCTVIVSCTKFTDK